MSGRMDKVEQQLMYVCSNQKEEAEWVVCNAIVRVKEQILVEVDKKVVALEARMEAKMNKTRQDTITTLQHIKDTMAAT